MPANDKQKLSDLFRNRRERGLPGLPVVSVTLNDGLVGRDTLDRKTDTNLAPEEHLLIKAGDIAYNMMRMWQGASGLAQHDGIVSPAYVVLAPKNGIDPLFASYWFKSPRMVYLFWAYSYGLTNDRLRLYFKDFAGIPVSVPPQEEQVRIGEILSLWDTAIAQTEKLIEAKRKLKKGLMQQLLTGKRRFPGVEGEWKDTPLGQMGRCVSGGTPDTNNSSYWNGGVQWCTPSEITILNSKYISSTRRTISNEGLNNSSANLLPPNTLIVCFTTGHFFQRLN
jgi:type I restriction enzyme S subunit